MLLVFFLKSLLNIYQHSTLCIPYDVGHHEVLLLSSSFSDLLQKISWLPGALVSLLIAIEGVCSWSTQDLVSWLSQGLPLLSQPYLTLISSKDNSENSIMPSVGPLASQFPPSEAGHLMQGPASLIFSSRSTGSLFSYFPLLP